MIHINDAMRIDDAFVEERSVRAMGPGGQNMRKEATAIELRLNIAKLPLPLEVRSRLVKLAGRHVTTKGVLIVASRAHRSLEMNREAARARLIALLNRAATPPAGRKPTAVSAAEKDLRLQGKKRRAATKLLRHGPLEEG